MVGRVGVLAIVVLVCASCGDPQLDVSRRERFRVGQTSWHTVYGPGLRVITPFPGLIDATDPRFESSDPVVARARLFTQEIDVPRTRALELATTSFGNAEISLFDGDVLVRTERIEVAGVDAWSFDFTIQNEDAPTEAALTNGFVELLQFSRAPATVRFYDSRGNEMAATGRITYSDGVEVDRDSTSARISGNSDRLSNGDIVSVAAIDSQSISLALPNDELADFRGDSPNRKPLSTASPEQVMALEMVISPQEDPGRPAVAVYGVLEGIRIVGLSPTVTLNGEPLEPFVTTARFENKRPWLFPLPEGATNGTIEARWRALSTSAELTEAQ